jgi:hypothetical protein
VSHDPGDHVSPFAHRASHITHHASRITLHASRFTHHASDSIQRLRQHVLCFKNGGRESQGQSLDHRDRRLGRLSGFAETEVNRAHSHMNKAEFSELATHLALVGQECFRRGWAVGTSGNFSAVVSHDPLHLAITSSGVNKGALTAADVLQVDR